MSKVIEGRTFPVCYPLGSVMAERTQSFGKSYRCGFNNQEQERELGEYYSFEYRVHDARLGRFLSVDPLAPEYPWNSCYAFAENRVIDCLDLEGLEAAYRTVMITGQVWSEPAKPPVRISPTYLYPKPVPPPKYSTSSSTSVPYKYTLPAIRRMPSDHMNPYSPSGSYY